MSSFAKFPAMRTLKQVADALVEDQLGRHARFDAAEYGGERPLAGARLADLAEQVAASLARLAEAGVALEQELERSRRSHGTLGLGFCAFDMGRVRGSWRRQLAGSAGAPSSAGSRMTSTAILRSGADSMKSSMTSRTS